MKNKLYALLTAAVVMVSSCSSPNVDRNAPIPENTSDLTSPNSFIADTLSGMGYSDAYFGDYDVTIINIWSMTCLPCIVELPEVAEFMGSQPDNVQLVTWCLEGSYNPDRVKSITERAGYTGVTLIDGDGDLAVLRDEIMYTPTTIFVDCDGNIIGDALIGAPKEFGKAYTELTNRSLAAVGKDEMQLQ